MDLSDDDHLHRAVIELGEPEALFRISHGRFLAKLTLGVLLVVYGLVANYLWWVHGPATFGHLEVLFLILPPLSGVSLLLHMYRHRGLFVLIYPSGLLRLRRGEVDSFPWHEVESVRLRVQRTDAARFTRTAGGRAHRLLVTRRRPDIQARRRRPVGRPRPTASRGTSDRRLSRYDVLAEEVQKLHVRGAVVRRPRPVLRRRLESRSVNSKPTAPVCDTTGSCSCGAS